MKWGKKKGPWMILPVFRIQFKGLCVFRPQLKLQKKYLFEKVKSKKKLFYSLIFLFKYHIYGPHD